MHPTHFLPTPSQDNPINSPSMSSTPQETLGNYKRNKWERVLFAFPQFLRKKFVQRAQKQQISSNCDALDKCSQDIDLWFESRSWHHLDCNVLPSNQPTSLLYGSCHFARLLLQLQTSTADTELLRTLGSNKNFQDTVLLDTGSFNFKIFRDIATIKTPVLRMSEWQVTRESPRTSWKS